MSDPAQAFRFVVTLDKGSRAIQIGGVASRIIDDAARETRGSIRESGANNQSLGFDWIKLDLTAGVPVEFRATFAGVDRSANFAAIEFPLLPIRARVLRHRGCLRVAGRYRAQVRRGRRFHRD